MRGRSEAHRSRLQGEAQPLAIQSNREIVTLLTVGSIVQF